MKFLIALARFILTLGVWAAASLLVAAIELWAINTVASHEVVPITLKTSLAAAILILFLGWATGAIEQPKRN